MVIDIYIYVFCYGILVIFDYRMVIGLFFYISRKKIFGGVF